MCVNTFSSHRIYHIVDALPFLWSTSRAEKCSTAAVDATLNYSYRYISISIAIYLYSYIYIYVVACYVLCALWSISGRQQKQLGQIPYKYKYGIYEFSVCLLMCPLDRLIRFDKIVCFIVRNKQLRVSKYCDVSQIYKSPSRAPPQKMLWT